MIQGAHHAFIDNINQYSMEEILKEIADYSVGVTTHLKILIEEEMQKSVISQGGEQ